MSTDLHKRRCSYHAQSKQEYSRRAQRERYKRPAPARFSRSIITSTSSTISAHSNNSFFSTMKTTTVIGVLALGISTASATCYGSGQFFPNREEARTFAHDACYNNGGMRSQHRGLHQIKSVVAILLIVLSRNCFGQRYLHRVRRGAIAFAQLFVCCIFRW